MVTTCARLALANLRTLPTTARNASEPSQYGRLRSRTLAAHPPGARHLSDTGQMGIRDDLSRYRACARGPGRHVGARHALPDRARPRSRRAANADRLVVLLRR